MSRAFLAYLAKERRDGRALLIGIPVVSVVVLVAGSFLTPHLVADPYFARFCALACLAIGLVAIAADALPSEVRRRRLGFLHRLPGGLETAYVAKVIHVVLALTLIALVGYGAANLVARLHGAPLSPEGSFGLGLLILLIGAGWVMTVSTWIPRGSLAVPCVGMALGLFGLPLWLIYGSAAGLEPHSGFVRAFVTILVVAPFVIGWLSFVRGRRHGGGAGSSAWRGILATAVLFVPAWGFAAYEAHDHLSLDPSSDRFRIKDGQAGAGGRLLFLNVTMERRLGDRRGAIYPLVLDSETGRWWLAGKAGECFARAGSRLPQKLVSIRDAEMSRRSRDGNEVWRRYYDGATGNQVKSGWDHIRYDEVEGYVDVPRLRNISASQHSFCPWMSYHTKLAIIFEKGGVGIIGIEDGRRIVRVVEPGAEVEVVFPKGADR